MALLEIRLLGPPRIDLAGRPIEVDTRKAIALLAYLAAEAQPLRRDSLAALLWPESDQSRARAALRRTLSSLNTAFGDYPLLEVSRGSIGLLPDADVSLDLAEFHREIEEIRATPSPPVDRLSAATALYRDDFMAGFSLRDSPAFDDWQYFQAERYRRDFGWALEQLAIAERARGDRHSAIQAGHRWLALDPLQETAHRLLMQLYAEAGDQPAAIRQYRECVRVLDDELGVLPLEETTALYEAILDRRTTPAEDVQPAQVVAELAEESPLVGREAERGRVLAAYREIGSSGRLFLIEGEAGIGKTSLAGEALAAIQVAGATTVNCRCYPGEQHFAYGALIDGFRDVIADLGGETINQLPGDIRSALSLLLPELGPGLDVPGLDSPGALRRFFDSLLAFLLALRRDGLPPALFIDDLHWSDQATRSFLSFLASRLPRSPIYVLMSWRSEEVADDSELRQLVANAARAGIANIIQLSPLTADQVAALARQVRPDISATASDWLFVASEGNPFFVTEYLAGLPAAQDEVDVSNVSQPDGIRDLYQTRLAPISETGRQLMSTAAVIGRSFDVDLLRDVSGRGEDEAVATVEELLRHRLIREPAHPDAVAAYDFSHENLRNFTYNETSLVRRRLLHRRAAETLERRHGASNAQIANHYQLAGEDERAAYFFERAGDEARLLYANTAAEHFYRAALEAGYPDPAIVHERLGDLLTLGGRYPDALNSYQQAAAHGTAGQLPRLEHKLGLLQQRIGGWDRAASHFRAALAATDPDDAGLRAQITADLSLTAFRQGNASGAERYGQEALDEASRAGDGRTLAQAHNLLGVLARNQDDLEKASRHLETSLELAAQLGEPGAQAAALNNLALCLADQGQPDQAVGLASQALDLCRTVGDRHREAALENNLADFYHQLGDEEQSMERLRRAVEIFAGIDDPSGELQPEIWKLIEW